MTDNIEIIQEEEFLIKIKTPKQIGIAPVLLLLHGWTGDENSMWSFASKIPSTYLVIAPRAPFKISNPTLEGFTWVENPSGRWSWLDDFTPSIKLLSNLLDSLSRQYEGNFSEINIAGFSQGAALTYAYAMTYPQKVNKIAGLAGFLPEICEPKLAQGPVNGKSIFIAHGTKDQIVKIDMAYSARDMLEKNGANVTFCESDVGHRLGSNCYSAFGKFISA